MSKVSYHDMSRHLQDKQTESRTAVLNLFSFVPYSHLIKRKYVDRC